MNRQGHIFFNVSNDLELLSQTLMQKLSKLKPFEMPWIVTPSPSLKNSIQNEIASTLKICMGINFYSLQPAMSKLLSLFYPEGSYETHLELSLRIQKEIMNLWLLEENKVLLQPLFEYLNLKSTDDSSEKLTHVCDHLASLFVTYALYCPNLQKDFDNLFSSHWQRLIWKNVFQLKNPFFDLDYFLNSPLKKTKISLKIFFFGLSIIPKPYYKILMRLQHLCDIEFFQLSFSSNFQLDITSDFEKSIYIKRLRQQKVKEGEICELRNYLSSVNPILANCHKLNKKWLEIIDEDETQISEDQFVLPQWVSSHKFYHDHISSVDTSFSDETYSLLSALKVDIFLGLRPSEFITFNTKDDSLEIHEVSTPERESEVFYANLLRLLDQNPRLSPCDVVVYVSDINRYYVYLKDMFERGSKGLEATFYNLSYSNHNSALSALKILFELSQDFKAETLLELFKNPFFMSKFSIREDTVALWQNWIEEFGVYSGYDFQDQKEAYEKKYGQAPCKSDVMPPFRALYDYILKSLCQGNSKNHFLKKLPELDFSDFELIDLFFEIISSLKEDLDFLKKNRLSLSDWALYLECIINSYFDFGSSKNSSASKIFSQLHFYKNNLGSFGLDILSFETFKYYFFKNVEDLELELGITKNNAVSIYSLKNSPSVGAKAVFILGLNDSVFPRPKKEMPLSLLNDFKQKNYHPASCDYDRNLFLQHIMGAKEFLILSYLGMCEKTFKKTEPSILISELISYLDRRFIINSHVASKSICLTHPQLNFSPSNFNKKNYFAHAFNLAHSFSNHKINFKEDEFEMGMLKLPTKISDKERNIKFSDLTSLFSNSMQFSLTKTFGTYFDKEELFYENKNFCLNALKKSILEQYLAADKKIEKEGLPRGVFYDVAEQRVHRDVENLIPFFSEKKIDPKNFFSVEFRKDCQKAYQYSKELWIAPAITISLGSLGPFSVEGVLENVCFKGLVSHKKFSKSHLFKEFPKYLAFFCFKNSCDEVSSTKWFFPQSEKEVEISIKEDHYKEAIVFYLLSKQTFLPFLPSWICAFESLSPSKLRERIDKDLNSNYFYHDEVQRLGKKIPFKIKDLELWKNLFVHTFSKTRELILK